MRTSFWLAGATALALAQPAMAADSIKIGFVSTFSGPTAVIGNDMRNSFELALDHLGRKIGGNAGRGDLRRRRAEAGRRQAEDREADPVRQGGLHRRLYLVERAAGLAQDRGRFADLPDQRQCRTVATRRRAVLALCVLDVLAERPDAGGRRPLHEPEERQVGIPDRPELCRRQGHAGRREEHLQGPGARRGIHRVAEPARLLGGTLQGARVEGGVDLRVLSGRGRRAVPQSVCAGRHQAADSALHRLHHRRIVAAVAEGERARRSRRAAVGERSAE